MLKKYSWVCLLMPTMCWATEKFEVNHAPYVASIEVEQCDNASQEIQCSGKGKITLTNQKLPNWSQQFFAEQLTFWLDKNRQPSKVMELYDEQSPIVFGDFNFDGSIDLAIHNGNEGGYGGPTYDVYVFAKNRNHFIKSKELTALASEHLGMFAVNSKEKYLEVRDKSGAGWHQTSRYAVVPNHGLKLIYQWTEEYRADGSIIITTKKLTKKGWQKTTEKIAQNNDKGINP